VAAEGLQGADAEPLADPNQDLRSNLEAFALGLSSQTIPTSGALPRIVATRNEITFVHRQRRSLHGLKLACEVEASENLEDWQLLPEGTPQVVDAIWQEISTPLPASVRFARLRFTLQP